MYSILFGMKDESKEEIRRTGVENGETKVRTDKTVEKRKTGGKEGKDRGIKWKDWSRQ
jgi:hypothetical protein